MERQVKIYTTPTCHFCHMAKEFLSAHEIKFEEFNVAQDAKARDEMIQKTGQLGVPVIDIDSKIVIGFDRGKISELLGIK